MEVRELGRTGIPVFNIGIGTGVLGMDDIRAVYVERRFDSVNEELGARALTAAIEGLIAATEAQGYSHKDARILVDTAALYGNRRSERIIGAVLQESPWLRDYVLITTKAGHTFGGLDYSRDALLASIDISKQLTGIEHFEVVYLHDPMGLPEEVVYQARAGLIDAGAADYVGIAANDPDTNLTYIQSGLFPVAVVPETTSLVNRGIERGIIQAAEEFNVGLVAATAIEKGWLTDNPPSDDASVPGRHFSRECLDHMASIRSLCGELGIPTLAAAMAWPTHAYPQVTTSLVGISSIQQATELSGAAATDITEEMWNAIEKLAVHFDNQRTTT